MIVLTMLNVFMFWCICFGLVFRKDLRVSVWISRCLIFWGLFANMMVFNLFFENKCGIFMVIFILGISVFINFEHAYRVRILLNKERGY